MKPSFIVYSLLAISFTCLGLVAFKVEGTADAARQEIILNQKKIDSLTYLIANNVCVKKDTVKLTPSKLN